MDSAAGGLRPPVLTLDDIATRARAAGVSASFATLRVPSRLAHLAMITHMLGTTGADAHEPRVEYGAAAHLVFAHGRGAVVPAQSRLQRMVSFVYLFSGVTIIFAKHSTPHSRAIAIQARHRAHGGTTREAFRTRAVPP